MAETVAENKDTNTKNSKVKRVGKEILTKLPVFLFCVIFIQINNHLFGTENSIVAVVILTGIFMFMRGDLGFRSTQAALCIWGMLFWMGIAAHLSLINPWIGLVINFFTISMFLILSSHDLTQGNHITFLMGYLFCLGYDVEGTSFDRRLICLVCGGAIIALLYFLIHRKKTYKRSMRHLFQEINIHSIRTQWYVRMVITLTVVIFVCDMLHYPRTMWIGLAVLSLTTPFGDEHAVRGKARIPAAILGTALFYVLFVVVIPESFQPYVVMLAGFLAMFIQDYFIKSIYNTFSALGTAVLLFPTTEALYLRVLSNVLGTIIAVCSYFIFNQIFKRISTPKTTDSMYES